MLPLPPRILPTSLSVLVAAAVACPVAFGDDTAGDSRSPAEHWAFRPLVRPATPDANAPQSKTAIDQFLQASLAQHGLTLSAEADRYALIRRVSFNLTGLPPTPNQIEAFVADKHGDAYERLVDRYLASPHYGERWGKWWLEAAGYADSNGYFNADTDRPLAYRYRDYVVASFNADKPFDRFIQEQIAGDEIAGYRPGAEVPPEAVELLAATHFLRNAQDGTGESDGNSEEVRADRFSVLEGTQQMIGSALLGMTLQCARCHNHKFEPITQADYYSLQAILAGAYDPDHWIKPNDRVISTATSGEIAAWEARMHQLDEAIAARRRELAAWIGENRPRGEVLFVDHFDAPERLALDWSNTAPGDDAPAGDSPVEVASANAPAAEIRDGALALIESGTAGNRWLSTTRTFEWAPAVVGASMQATFDLVADKVPDRQEPAARIGYYLSLHDYNDNSERAGGNILIDGNPKGGADVHLDYPGTDARPAGHLGTHPYQPGHNYGVRITNSGNDTFLIEQLVDGLAETPTITLKANDLTPGGFGFEFCCGRSFVVDNIVVEAISPGTSAEAAAAYQKALDEKRKSFDAEIASINRERSDRPGRTAVLLDVSPSPPDWHVLVRGNYGQQGKPVPPGVPAVLAEPANDYHIEPPGGASSGRRLALARWLTRPSSRAASLLARVTANRVWQQHFGTGLCSTPENLGLSGSTPMHRELLDYLAAEFVESGWKLKRLHRLILLSAAYRQSSAPHTDGLRFDPDNRLLWRFPIRRLDAESLRDAALAIAGELDSTMGGPYVPTNRDASGAVLVDESKPGGKRRSLYLQQRRTQMLSLLEVFDSPSIVVNCTRRNQATIPLQSLSALNSEFAIRRAAGLGQRLLSDTNSDVVTRAFMLVIGRPPNNDERAASEEFLRTQPGAHPGLADAGTRALVDFCQMLLASNAFLYVE